jgi:hypothetical protein
MNEDERREASAKLATTLEAITAVDPSPWAGGSAVIMGMEAFDAMSGGVARANHARDAARSPDSTVTFEYQGSRMVIATRATHLPRQDFVLIVVGGWGQAGKPIITAAYRLYRPPDEVDALAADARQAFQAFLEEHAIEYQPEPEGEPEIFRPVITGPIIGDPMETISAALGLQQRPGRYWTVNGQGRQNPDDTMTMTFPFAVDLDDYRESARRNGWRG